MWIVFAELQVWEGIYVIYKLLAIVLGVVLLFPLARAVIKLFHRGTNE
jgi:hypothetical protein